MFAHKTMSLSSVAARMLCKNKCPATAFFSTTPLARSTPPESTTPQPSNTLFIGSLPFSAHAADIQKLVEEAAGAPVVVDVRLAINRDTGNSRGFAHVDIMTAAGENSTAVDASSSSSSLVNQIVQALDGASFGDRVLRCNMATSAPPPSGDRAINGPTDVVTFNASPSDTMKTLFVGGIPFQNTRAQLRDMFDEAVGHPTVSNVRLVRDKATHKLRGYCYVDVASEEDALKVMQALNGKPVSDTSYGMRIAFDTSKVPTSSTKASEGQSAAEQIAASSSA